MFLICHDDDNLMSVTISIIKNGVHAIELNLTSHRNIEILINANNWNNLANLSYYIKLRLQ